MRNIKYFTAILFLSMIIPMAQAQEFDEKIAARLKEDKIDTCMVYKSYWEGSIHSDTCNWSDPVWLLWVKDGQYFQQYFARCKSVAKLPIGPLNPLAFYLAHAGRVAVEQIQEPTYTKITKKGRKSDEDTWTSSLSHGLVYHFNCKVGEKQVEKYISDYNLETAKLGNGMPNQHYVANRRSATFALIRYLRSWTGTTYLQWLPGPKAKPAPSLNGTWIPEKINWKEGSFYSLLIQQDTSITLVAATSHKNKDGSIDFGTQPGFIVRHGTIIPVSNTAK
ncbi:hypothetical protein [Paraflavitalea pollutisoli]|uniref:hypothetical protein n=1 Tax=Paraflavitalea pollutisoli TaxID=3034143 RepID=UPI0023EB7186|nr:hypothetical protein [Paraflavitalea sp. H1-2-19X]